MESDGTPRYVELNVGGIHYTTLLSTLTRYPDSLLYEMFSKTKITLGKDRKGRYIIDRDGEVFRYILNFLREETLNPHLSMKEYYQLRKEVSYYKLKKMKSLLNNWKTGKIKRINPDQQNDRTCTQDSREDISPEMLGLDPDNIDIDNESDRELSDESDAPSWFMDTKPHRSPYVPQMGDEVMYFWQGHKYYVEAVKRQGVYDIDERKFPWDCGDLKTEEPMRVVGLEYHSGPTITCEIKLASIDHVSKKVSGKTFKFRYHVMPEMKDFMILTQHYEISMKKKWKVGDQFRAVIGNKWWLGVIEEKLPTDKDYPECPFQCFAIRWNNGSKDVLSPWDLDRNENKNSPIKSSRGIPITKTDMQQLLYNPKPGDWDESDQNTECDRILACLDQIMSLEVTKILTVTIDRSDEPDDSMVVPYPIDLDTITKRLETRFYRRRLALQWEVKQFESNAPLFNEPNSDFVKSAELVTNILLQVVRNVKVNNAVDLYNRLVGISDTNQKTERKQKKRSRSLKKVSPSKKESDDETKIPPKKRRSTRTHDEKRWMKECKNLLDILFALESSKYFRTPINTSVFKEYLGVIEEPMDLTTVKERLNSGDYEDPHEFAKDIRLIVSNSKAYFTDKTLEIHTMTREFSKLFEDSIRDTLMNYKNAAAYKKLAKGNGTPSPIKKGKDRKQSPRKKLTPHDKPGPSGTQKLSKSLQGEGRPLLRGEQYPKQKNREEEWLRSLPGKIPQSIVEEFKNLIWNKISNEILPGYGMTPDEMARLCGEGDDKWLLSSHMVYILHKITQSQDHTLCFCLNATCANERMTRLINRHNSCKDIRQLVFIVNVGKLPDSSVFIGNEVQPGNHWTLVVVKLSTRESVYCDSMAWGVPGGLLARLNEYTSFFNVNLSIRSLKVCHTPTREGQYHSCQITCSNYPLQTCSDVCGVVAILCAAIATFDLQLFDFLCGPRSSEHFYLRDPTKHAKYLRCVLISWFMTGRIDIKNVSIRGLPRSDPFLHAPFEHTYAQGVKKEKTKRTASGNEMIHELPRISTDTVNDL